MDKQIRILAVDDEIGNLQLISGALQGEYDILTAQNGHDAISQITEYMPDLILLDVMMPEISGFDLCKIIKANPLFADIPVIFLTAMDAIAGEIEGLKLGGLDYLTKPVDIAVLKLRVRNQITLKKQRDLLQQQKEELERALARVRQLEDILPLYSNCNKMRSAKILIVDDDGMNRKMLHLMLSKHFDNLLMACNGQEGLDLLGNNSDIDLILLDLEMPVMDGREMLTVVKNLPNLKSIVVIIVASNREDAISTLVLGADDFITKPYDKLELSTRVTHHLQKKYESSEHLRTEQKLQAITDSAQDAILMIDPQGIITYVNPAALEIFGYHPKEMLGENLHDLLVSEHYFADHKTAFHEFQHSGTGNAIGKTVELYALRKDGQEIAVELSLASIFFSGGWHAVGTVRDITERKGVEAALVTRTEEAEEASRTKSTFLATMSHDIRTPISG